MNRYIFLIFFLWIPSSAQVLNVCVTNAQKHQKINILLALVGNQTDQSDQLSLLVKKALEFKNQCALTVQYIPQLMNKQMAQSQKAQGFDYILFVQLHKENIDWHLFEVDEGTILKSKKIVKRENMRGWAYALSDSVYETLTNEPGFFSTKIAYCKQISGPKGKQYKHIYIADYDGSNPELLVGTPTINVAPRWNKDASRPLLFYSENTNSNMRMMAVNMDKKMVVASNFDGLNMLPAFSPDGQSVVYCATRGSGNCQLYHWSHKVLKKITNNEGNNFSPIFSDDNQTIYFSSDFQTKNPQIYAYNMENQQLEQITTDGYCVSPSFCKSRGQLAYAKMVNGVMQLFTYDLKTKEHTQLTFDKAHKEDCMWSACGTFLLCPFDDGTTSRIALFNTIIREYRYLTSEKDNCSYPAWSGIYKNFPIIS